MNFDVVIDDIFIDKLVVQDYENQKEILMALNLLVNDDLLYENWEVVYDWKCDVIFVTNSRTRTYNVKTM